MTQKPSNDFLGPFEQHARPTSLERLQFQVFLGQLNETKSTNARRIERQPSATGPHASTMYLSTHRLPTPSKPNSPTHPVLLHSRTHCLAIWFCLERLRSPVVMSHVRSRKNRLCQTPTSSRALWFDLRKPLMAPRIATKVGIQQGLEDSPSTPTLFPTTLASSSYQNWNLLLDRTSRACFKQNIVCSVAGTQQWPAERSQRVMRLVGRRPQRGFPPTRHPAPPGLRHTQRTFRNPKNGLPTTNLPK